MTERLLQYIWQFQYFNRSNLLTESGEALEILHPGNINHNQGPDFTAARIKIGNTTWAGNIELHVNSSHWNDHGHSHDKNYKNIVLHVVWCQDIELLLPCATLVLQHRVAKVLLGKYDELMNARSYIPCEKHVSQVNSITWQSWKERLLVERLEQRTKLIAVLLQKSNDHWEEVCWWLLARNFGTKINSDAFEAIARSLPVRLLAWHKGQLHQLEALLFGQAALLETVFTEAYPVMLQKEYRFLQKKYALERITVPPAFLRMRPSNFPSVRLAQLAMLVHQSQHFFSRIKECADVEKVKELLQVVANDYWHYHYRFDEPSAFKKKKLGSQMTANILINTVVPLLFAYGHLRQEPVYKEKALQWLEALKAEENSITRIYGALEIENKTAFDSQALLQLKKEYCDERRCLDCSIGNKLLKSNP